LSAVEDVFYLSADELVAGTATSAGSVQAVSLAELQKRQATRVRFMQVKPPPLLGTSPAANFTPNSAFFRAMRKAEVIAPQPSPLPT
jgi:hypothetical protein